MRRYPVAVLRIMFHIVFFDLTVFWVGFGFFSLVLEIEPCSC
jgi:hypothetical protein